MDSTSVLHPGFSPLHLAILSEEGDNDTKIKALLDQGASPAALTPQGDTPLHLTLISKRYGHHIGDEVRTPIDDRLFLLEDNPIGSNGFSHCHIACLFGKLEIVRSFLDRGLDPDRHQTENFFWLESETVRHDDVWYRDTCLHVAMYAAHSDVVQLLLERGADPNARGSKTLWKTPLHYLKHHDRHGSATKLLLEYGADVNARNGKDETPLHLQCFCDPCYQPNVVKALLEGGADINIVNSDGVTALQDYISKVYGGGPSLMMDHAVSLQEAGFDLIGENLESILEFEEIHDMREYRNDCKCELNRMKDVRLDESTTLREALRIHEPRRLQLLADNEEFGRIVADEATLGCEFPIYGHIARLQYRRGVRIAEFKEAVLALQKLYACTAKYHNGLPEECAEMVLRYLTWADQRHLIQAVLR